MSLWLADEDTYVEDEPDCVDDEPPTVDPCPVCGAAGACSYDAEGRPLIHTDTQLPEDPQ
ncbi:MAG TPA: hypothetical protein VIP77_19590 [Jiangellaceae bacterium]